MTSRTVRWIIILACLAVTSSAVWAQDKVTLSLKLESGKKYDAGMMMDQTITETIQGHEVHVAQTIGMGMVYDVTSVDPDGTMHINVKYDWVVFKQDASGMQTQYDSRTDKGPIPPTAQGFAGIVGEGFEMHLGPDGSVKKLVGTDHMITAMINKLTVPPGPMLEQLKAALHKQFNDDTLRQNMEKMTRIFPDGPVAIGDSWSRTQEVKIGMQAKIANTWTLKKIENGQATIAISSKIEPLDNAEPIDMGIMKMKMDMNGTQDGEFVVKLADGWTQQATLAQDLKGKMVLTNSQNAETMELPMLIKGDTKITGKVE